MREGSRPITSLCPRGLLYFGNVKGENNSEKNSKSSRTQRGTWRRKQKDCVEPTDIGEIERRRRSIIKGKSNLSSKSRRDLEREKELAHSFNKKRYTIDRYKSAGGSGESLPDSGKGWDARWQKSVQSKGRKKKNGLLRKIGRSIHT